MRETDFVNASIPSFFGTIHNHQQLLVMNRKKRIGKSFSGSSSKCHPEFLAKRESILTLMCLKNNREESRPWLGIFEERGFCYFKAGGTMR